MFKLISIVSLIAIVSACNRADANLNSTDTGGEVEQTTLPCSVDADGDGFCDDEDCDDLDAGVNPDATEECDGIDNDCDDEVDEEVTDTYYYDNDNDGFGNSASAVEVCEAETGYVLVSGDCEDNFATIYPGAEELCDGIDNNCDEEIDNSGNCDGDIGRMRLAGPEKPR